MIKITEFLGWVGFFFDTTLVFYFRIALCVDGQSRFCIHSHNLLGEEAIKQRHLRLLGYEVVQVRSKDSGLLLLWLAKQVKNYYFMMPKTVVPITSQSRCSLVLSIVCSLCLGFAFLRVLWKFHFLPWIS